MFDNITEAICKELEMLDEKYSKGTQLTDKDLQDIDKMAHTLKSLAGYEAMKGNSEYGGSYDSYEGGSYARGRSRTTGRYISRESGYSRDGYSRDGGSYERR